jgi:hypothetical protein
VFSYATAPLFNMGLQNWYRHCNLFAACVDMLQIWVVYAAALVSALSLTMYVANAEFILRRKVCFFFLFP